MIIGRVDAMGLFSGGYRSAVTSSNQPVGPSIMRGIMQRGPQPTFGFIVKWADSGKGGGREERRPSPSRLGCLRPEGLPTPVRGR